MLLVVVRRGAGGGSIGSGETTNQLTTKGSETAVTPDEAKAITETPCSGVGVLSVELLLVMGCSRFHRSEMRDLVDIRIEVLCTRENQARFSHTLLVLVHTTSPQV
jgi:hypothetical protein